MYYQRLSDEEILSGFREGEARMSMPAPSMQGSMADMAESMVCLDIVTYPPPWPRILSAVLYGLNRDTPIPNYHPELCSYYHKIASEPLYIL
jgi:hypothetical protein